jgi:signal peptidase I
MSEVSEKEQSGGKAARRSSLWEWLETIVFALLAAFLIRAFVVQVYMVEGESMEPTLHSYERLLVNKFIYRFRDPKPGEIVVLQDPGRPNRELIKRVIAVAGETVEVKHGVVYINDRPLKEPYKNTEYPVPDTPKTVVPPGHIYVMGDNRGRSWDSRQIGAIELKQVDGKAIFMFWPLNRFGAGPLDQPRTFEQG